MRARTVLGGTFAIGIAAIPALSMEACGLDLVGSGNVDPDAASNGPGFDGGALPTDDSSTTPIDNDGATITVDGAPLDDGGSSIEAAAPCVDMIEIESSVTPKYCIDPTEVTEVRYQKFIAEAPAVVMPVECQWAATRHAGSTRGPSKPVSDVDWCDAFAFCAWAGKRLCTEAEWQFACNDGTTRLYSYGDVFDQNACNGGPIGSPTDVGTMPNCHGQRAGLVDLIGNIDEWSAKCTGNAGATDSCTTHGGDWQNDAEGELRCTSVQSRARNSALGQVGFRCCK